MIDLSKYNLLQDRDNDESYTNGVWDLSYEVSNEKMEQEQMYNFLQEFKEKVLAEVIDDLEKVKKKILSYEEIYYQFLQSGAKIPVVCVENFRVKQAIEQQINKLKGKDIENRSET